MPSLGTAPDGSPRVWRGRAEMRAALAPAPPCAWRGRDEMRAVLAEAAGGGGGARGVWRGRDEMRAVLAEAVGGPER